MIYKGDNLRVMVGGKCICQSTTCTVQINRNMDESSTKDSANLWAENEPGMGSWSIQCDSLTALTDNGSNGETTIDLLDIILGGTKVQLTFDVTAGTMNRVGQNSAIKMTGYAYLNDTNIQAAHAQNSSTGYTFTGTGALTRASA